MRVNFARLNHILIPGTKDGRDRLRRGPIGKLARPLVWLFGSLSREGRALAAASVFAAAFGFEVRTSEAHVVWSALVALLVASVLVARPFVLRGVGLVVQTPRRITVGEEVAFTVALTHGGSAEHQAVRVSGPFLPWDGRWTHPTAAVASLRPGETRRVEMRARFVERGEHHLDPFHASALVPFGLALGPAIASAGCRFLVVPRIAHVTRVTLPTGTRHQPGGVALASKTGESMDLLGVRPYRPGDSVRDLHARSWARRGFPVVREFQQEYFSRVGVILDTERAAIGDPGRLEAAISLASGVVYRLSRGEALIDLLVVGGTVHTLTLGRALGSFEQALDRLACVEPGPTLDPDALLGQLAPHLRRLSCLVIVALDWDDRRVALARRIREHGIAVRALVLDAPASGQDVRRVESGAIARGEVLAL